MKDRWPLVGCVLVFSILVAYRATVIPITHDEASTWLNFRFYPIWKCISEYYCWQTANNHWLNTLLLQWSAGLFGESVLAIRLPNVVAGALYFISAALLSYRFINSPILRVAGFMLLCAHLYLLDFFSLARGYGLMACGILWGIYGLLCYLQRNELRWLLLSVLAMVLAVLSNFTALLAFACMGTTWLVWMIRQNKISLLARHGLVWIFTALVLCWLLYYPIRILRGTGEFDWGASGLTDTINDLIRNLLYGEAYFGDGSRSVLLWILSLMILAVSISAVLYKHFNSRPQLLFVLVLLVLNLAGIVALEKFTGAHAPVGRKSIYLIPLLFAPLALGLNLVAVRKMNLITSLFISCLLVYHTIRSITPAACREWYYDAHYPDVLSVVLPNESTVDTVRLGSSWIFNPSLTFYQKSKSLPLSGLAYQKTILIDTSMQYYFVEQSDTAGMDKAGFVQEKLIGSFYLFKNIHHSPAGPPSN